MKIDELEIVCLFFVKGENTVVSQSTKSFTTVKNRLKRFGFVYFSLLIWTHSCFKCM